MWWHDGSSRATREGPATWDGHPRCLLTSVRDAAPRGNQVSTSCSRGALKPGQGQRTMTTPHPHDAPRRTGTGAWQDGDPVGSRLFARVVDGRPFRLESGDVLRQIDVAYETWGELNETASNAILVCHALTGDSHAAGRAGIGHPAPGWWSDLIGPGRGINTDRWFVVCANVLGGCQGTTGPASVDPATGHAYGSTFPVVTMRDIVRTQALLADRLGVSRWHSVVGGSMGGMQALEWSIMYPGRLASVVVMASAVTASAQQIAWSSVGRRAVQFDPDFAGGDYYDGPGPGRGLALARQIALIHYRTEAAFASRFGRTLLDGDEDTFTMDQRFEVEGYLGYHGEKLVRRFDANSYLRLNKAMDLHDVGRGRGGAPAALRRVTCPALIGSITTDALYPPHQQDELVAGLRAAEVRVGSFEIDSIDGHDAFLIEAAQIAPTLAAFLDGVDDGPRLAADLGPSSGRGVRPGSSPSRASRTP